MPNVAETEKPEMLTNFYTAKEYLRILFLISYRDHMLRPLI